MDELDLARELAGMADEISMRYFATDPAVTTKADGTPVTEADREIEDTLRRRIEEAFPEHSIAGEEGVRRGERNKPVWVIDPIDGTANFVSGIPVFATLVGLRVEGRTELGVVSAPALGERYEAAAGDGARLNGDPISVSTVENLGESVLCFGSIRRLIRHGYGDAVLTLLSRCKRDRGFGDFWGHMLVARGAVEAMAEPALEPWDIIPLEVVLTEAGGSISTLEGDPFPDERLWGDAPRAGCVSSNGRVHDQLVSVFKGARRL